MLVLAALFGQRKGGDLRLLSLWVMEGEELTLFQEIGLYKGGFG